MGSQKCLAVQLPVDAEQISKAVDRSIERECCSLNVKDCKQTDRQLDGQTDRWTEEWTNRQAGRQVDTCGVQAMCKHLPTSEQQA